MRLRDGYRENNSRMAFVLEKRPRGLTDLYSWTIKPKRIGVSPKSCKTRSSDLTNLIKSDRHGTRGRPIWPLLFESVRHNNCAECVRIISAAGSGKYLTPVENDQA
jgi:hypothetical protein